MQIVMFLVPVMLILVAFGVVLFSWAVKNGQYDDLEGPAHRILYDDDKDMIPDDSRTDKPARQDVAEEKPADNGEDSMEQEEKSEKG